MCVCIPYTFSYTLVNIPVCVCLLGLLGDHTRLHTHTHKHVGVWLIIFGPLRFPLVAIEPFGAQRGTWPTHRRSVFYCTVLECPYRSFYYEVGKLLKPRSFHELLTLQDRTQLVPPPNWNNYTNCHHCHYPVASPNALSFFCLYWDNISVIDQSIRPFFFYVEKLEQEDCGSCKIRL